MVLLGLLREACDRIFYHSSDGRVVSLDKNVDPNCLSQPKCTCINTVPVNLDKSPAAMDKLHARSQML